VRTLRDYHPDRFYLSVMTGFTSKKGKLTCTGYAKLDHIRDQDRKKWLGRMGLYRQIRYVKHILQWAKN
jgi:hypothetical protein